MLQIAQPSRRVGKAAQAGVKRLYRRLLGSARAGVREAEPVVRRAVRRSRELKARLRERVKGLVRQVREMKGLTERVLEQTKARVLQGARHYPDKGLSVFAKHTEAIRQGKAVKPTEFGKLVKGQEAESQFITAYQVCADRVPDGELWEPALERHEQLFGRSPRLATADAAFGSAANEEAARARGVRRVALPAPGRCSAARRATRASVGFGAPNAGAPAAKGGSVP